MNITRRSLFAMLFVAPFAKLLQRRKSADRAFADIADIINSKTPQQAQRAYEEWRVVTINYRPADSIMDVRVDGRSVPYEADLERGTIRLL